MERREMNTDTELQWILDEGKKIHPVSDIVRARSLSRARAAIATTAAASRTSSPTMGRRWLSVGVAASVAFVLGAAAWATVQRLQAPAPVSSIAIPHVDPPASTLDPETPIPPLPEAPPAPPVVKAHPARHSLSPQESYTAETKLLSRAQRAYLAKHFSITLSLVAEHGRKFPNGRLAEEREALRIQALSGAGRTEESRSAAASFARRFPRSVLLPRLGAATP
jgi:hypothetical protein